MKYLTILYTAIKIIIVITLCILISIPFYYFLQYINKQKKTIKIYPKFEIVKIENKETVDIETTKEALRIGKEILKKVK